ncbi:sulfatase [Planctomycetota bacterium]
MNRPGQTLLSIGVLCFIVIPSWAGPPNVIFFATDDLCDWVGPLGYAQAVTPNLDKLAQRGVTFTNAHCPGTFCAPSRSAIFTGRYASTTGCYTTQVYFQNRPELKPMQQAFKEGGYTTFGAGKLFHHPAGYVDLRAWDEFFVRSEAQKRTGWPLNSWGNSTPKTRGNDIPIPEPYPNSVYNRNRKPANRFFLEWGAVPNEREEEMADTQRINWACNVLRQKHDKPFLLAVGLYAPHFPNYSPQKYFDLYDAEQIKAPPYKEDDLDDLPPKIRKAKINRKRQHHERLEEIGAIEDAIHGYLAAVSYADAMLGRLLETLHTSPYHDNTIIVFWSDHGYHHGEKGDWGKHTLWERTTNVPFLWAGPGVKNDATIDATANLIDMYPTFIDMCGLPAVKGLEGTSLVGVLGNPSTAEDRNVYVPYLDPGGYAIINQKWRYIHYSDNTEELYDLRSDPNEWHNLAENEAYTAIKQALRRSAPTTFAPAGITSKGLRLVTEEKTFHWKTK